MKVSSDHTPIACCLISAELHNRAAMILARFRSVVIEIGELPEGYAFHLPGDDKGIRLIAELIAAERECCPFLTFEMAAFPNLGPVIVRVTGPPGTKEFLRTFL